MNSQKVQLDPHQQQLQQQQNHQQQHQINQKQYQEQQVSYHANQENQHYNEHEQLQEDEIQQKQQQNQFKMYKIQRSRSRQRQRSRSRERQKQKYYQKQKYIQKQKPQYIPPRLKAGQMNYHQFLLKQQQFHANQQILRSFLRIQQNRQQPIDRFVKVLYTYKGKYEHDPRLLQLMNQPKKYLNKFTLRQLQSMIVPARRHLQAEERNQKNEKNYLNDDGEKKYVEYWKGLIKLIQYKIMKKKDKQIMKNSKKQQNDEILSLQSYQIKQKIKNMMNKSTEELVKLNKKIQVMLKNSSFGVDMSYWEKIREKVRGKLIQSELKKYYQHYKQHVLSKRQHINSQQQLSQLQPQSQPISPILQPYTNINIKFLITQQQQVQQRLSLSQSIFRQQFQKFKQKLQSNLSLPKNHNLINKDFITQSSKTYDLITQQIMQFQKYKRMQDDQQQFDDWVPIDTEGRFRDKKPEYINRVKLSKDYRRWGMSGMIKRRIDQKAPPPRRIVGYKFNIFYPDLYDKEKTPQYYLQPLQDPNHCLIKFKAGPPYKDIAFKILRKQWDFTSKSGFEAIFAKGILQLYFNFKRPKYRI